MYIFLDESGDLGFNTALIGSSRFFIIGLLVCENLSTLQVVRLAIKNTLKQKINHKAKTPKSELKGKELRFTVMEYFFKQINELSDLKFYTAIINKHNYLPIADKHRVYNKLVSAILKHVIFPSNIKYVHFMADQCKQGKDVKEFNFCIKEHLQAILPLKTFVTIEHLRSETEKALQATDLFAYSIYRKYEKGDLRWFNLIKEKIKEEIIIFE